MKITKDNKTGIAGLISNASSSGSSPSTVEVLDQGISLTTALASMDFVGAGVVATTVGNDVTVTIGSNTSPFVTFEDYGGVGDNTTDDTAAVQAAVDAWKETGATIWVTPGKIFKITATIDVDPAAPTGNLQFLTADGGDTPPGRIRMATANTTAFSLTTNASGTTFTNVWIYGPGGGSSGAGILSTKDVHTVGVRIQGFYNGLSLGAGSFYSKHIRSMFYLNTNAGVLLAAGGNNIEFIGCRVQTGALGYDIAGALSAKIIGGSVEACTTAGIRANGGTNAAGLLIEGVYFEQGDGIPDILLGSVSAVRGVTLSGNTHVKSSYSGTGWAVDAPNAIGLVLTGGSIDSSDAIRVNSSSTACTIIEPHLRNAGTVTIPAGSIYIRAGTTTVALGLGTAAHGASSELAPIDHVHPLGTPTVGGDLSGTLPNPTVAKINGVAVTGTPAVGDEIVATGATTATWQTPTAIPTVPAAHAHVDNLTFSGDGATTDFEIPASPVDAFSVGAYVAGVRTAITMSGALLTTMTFAVAPVSGTDNIIVDIAAAFA